jgi:two-component system chemotaxis sensor kinase CheA
MSSFADENIISDFVTESREHLSSIEPDLLAMEQLGSSAPSEVINRVFRAIHSIKGGAGFFAFENLKRLSHSMESVLMQVRDGKLAVTPEVMDVVLASLDRLRAMLDDINASDSVPCAKEMEALAGVLERQGVAAGATVKGKIKGGPEFNLDAESVRSSLRRGMTMYQAVAYLHKDITDQGMTPLAFLNNALSVGNLLDAYLDVMAIPDLDHCLDTDLPVTLLFGTVLEPDLAALALKLPVAQLKAMDMSALKKQAAPAAAKPPKPAEVAKEEVPEQVDEPAPAADVPADAPVEAVAEAGAAKQAVRGDAGSETLRVKVDLLTSLMNLAGELVLSRNQLLRALEGHHKEIHGLGPILQNVNQVTTEMQEGIMQTRMQPIGTVFSRFPRIVRDMSRQLGKQIEVQIQGAEVELDKSIVEMLADPLTHIIRNCADHALEPPLVRQSAGKNPTGNILLRAYHEGGQVNIEIRDDGRGIDHKKVGQKAVQKGVITEAQLAEMTEREVVNLIFAPGFSTAEQVSEVSGRGVGMDVVRTNTEKLGGHVDVETQVGRGTTVRLRLPLTLAIIPSMVVGVSGQRFAIPQVNVVEFVWVKAAEVRQRIEQVQGALVLRLRDKLLPLVRLSDVLSMERTYIHPETGERKPDQRKDLIDRRGMEDGKPEPAAEAPPAKKGRKSKAQAEKQESEAAPTRGQDRRSDWRSDHNIVVLRLGNNAFGAIVDELFDIEEIVVKPLSTFIQGTKCFSGATILGDGRVIMILDAGGLATTAHLHFTDLQAQEKKRAEEEAERAMLKASRRRSVILFKAADEEHFAVPQEKVQRLERLLASQIQKVGDKEFMQYRDEGLPLVRLDRHMEVRPIPKGLEELYVIIPKCTGTRGGIPTAGILISTILDAVDVDTELKPSEIRGTGLLGSAMVNEHLTLFLDPDPLLAAEVHSTEAV